MRKTPKMNYSNKAHRAKVQLFSWLEAVNIPVREVPGLLAVVVDSADDRMVVIGIDVPGEKLPESDMIINFDQIRAHDADDAKRHFAQLTTALGYGARCPVDRGVDNDEKDDILFTMRHKELRRSPDPKPAIWARYTPVIRKCVDKFYYPNQRWCKQIGYDKVDIEQWANFYFVNYWGNYRILDESSTENERLLTHHLNQRLGALRDRFKAEAKRQCIHEVEYLDDLLMPPSVSRPEFVEEDADMDDDERQEVAKGNLYTTLATAPVPFLITRLQTIINSSLSPKVKKLAKKELQKLRKV